MIISDLLRKLFEKYSALLLDAFYSLKCAGIYSTFFPNLRKKGACSTSCGPGKLVLPPFRPKYPIVAFRNSPFSPDISKSTKWMAVKFYRTSGYHYKAFTCKI